MPLRVGHFYLLLFSASLRHRFSMVESGVVLSGRPLTLSLSSMVPGRSFSLTTQLSSSFNMYAIKFVFPHDACKEEINHIVKQI